MNRPYKKLLTSTPGLGRCRLTELHISIVAAIPARQPGLFYACLPIPGLHAWAAAYQKKDSVAGSGEMSRAQA